MRSEVTVAVEILFFEPARFSLYRYDPTDRLETASGLWQACGLIDRA